MSKGGAGKVYFVLYLAVILELLIIFIERDEAEEHLRRQQREAIQIVQTILSQLQTGQGVSAITTRPKDNITLDDKDPETTVRVYDVLVAVGDSNSVRDDGKGGKIHGDDIPELFYRVSHNGDPNIPEEELPLDTADLNDPFFIAELGTNLVEGGGDKHQGYFQPKQVTGTSIPTGDPTAYFQLNEEMTAQELAKGRRVKVFRVNFKPTQDAGWYRLRFESQTNQIMGVIGAEPSDQDTVRIGNVKLTVKQLRSVQKFLEKERDDPNQQVVLQYINKLLDPKEWPYLPGNQGANAIDVHVVRPDLPPPAEPVARINFPRQDIYWYAGAPYDVPITVGPQDGGSWRPDYGNIIKGEDGKYQLVVDNLQVGDVPLRITSTNGAGQTAEDTKTLHVLKPELSTDVRRLRLLRATIGSKYLPEAQWAATQIPPEHYLTEVKFDDKVVFSRVGLNMDPPTLPNELKVPSTTKEIKTVIYWLAGGDASKRIPILSTDPSVKAIVAEYNFPPINPTYKAPTQDAGFEFIFPINGKKWDIEYDEIEASQVVGPDRTAGVRSIDASCDDCAEYGLSQPRVSQVDEKKWKLFMEVVDKKKLAEKAREVNGKKFLIQLKINGLGSQSGTGTVDMTMRIGG